jgi:hypothetical protein
MATPDTSSERPHPRGDIPSHAAVERDLGVLQRWSKRNADRRLARLLRPRSRRALAEQLRRTAKDANDRNRWRACHDLLLRYRAALVRTELLEIAAMLEQVSDPDPACVTEIRDLLANGDSPLYHPAVHVSELYATLYYIRAGLVSDPAFCSAAGYP